MNHPTATYSTDLCFVFFNYLLIQHPGVNWDLQPPSLCDSSREVGEKERAGAEKGPLPCSGIYSLLGLVRAVRAVISAEEVEHLVPEANIRLRPVENYPPRAQRPRSARRSRTSATHSASCSLSCWWRSISCCGAVSSVCF